MSLEILIDTVKNETEESEEKIQSSILNLIEKFGTNHFNDDDIQVNVSNLEILLCEKLHEAGLLNIVFQYHCHENAGDEETKNLSDKCSYCMKILHDGARDHEINRVYNFSRGHYDKIVSYISMKDEQKYFMPELQRNFENLKKDIDTIIPFLGAGVSIPLGLPNWENLLKNFYEYFPKEHLKEVYRDFIDEGDFFGALDYLMDKSQYISNEDQLKEEIIRIMATANYNLEDEKHNFFDFVELKSDYYITTNYDLAMERYLTLAGDYNSPICMDEIGSLRNMSTTGNSIIHLHGHINRKSAMIVTNRDYNKLYTKKGTMMQLSAILGTRPLLFLGFSFKDKFFVKMYEKLISILKTDHYIVLFNPELSEIKELNMKNVKVIGLNVTDGNHAKAIKTLINFLNQNN
ncbi:hypothetical protein C173_03194 [Paenibacillus sp. FSL R7-277]|uniref:SIR2 family NAD-dependent protein deacylase n=1 Tax=Paenibacillus sp. FSL R7-277 TaxID=1227352 RepID=UPI0003E2A73C|nr:SIR2 family protein [Paenibacillus sp. FSL R7-277]ETT77488.1 hypothetical protein C173_03194 [Paenibacillus sp. FSL R7-277]